MRTATIGNTKKGITITPTNFALAVMFLCSLLTGLLPQELLSVIILAMCAILFWKDTLYLAFPFMIFYYEFYGKILSVSVHRIFTLMFVALEIIKMLTKRNGSRRVALDWKLAIPLGIYLLFCLSVLWPPLGFQSALFSYFDIICMCLLVTRILSENETKLIRFFKTYVGVALVAYITGLAVGNVLEENSVETLISRFQATFEDPNYMGLFYTVAVFSIVTLRLFGPRLRPWLLVVLSAMLLSSLSISAVIANVVLWFVYLAAVKKIKVKTLVALLLVIVLLLGLYFYGLENPKTPVIGNLSYRIDQKLTELQAGNINDATTGRTDLTRQHWEYFVELPPLKMLFGGTSVNCSYIDPDVYGAAHNEYVDMLLNIGVLGTVLMSAYVISVTCQAWMGYQKTKSRAYFCHFMNKIIWLVYAATLTLFLDYRFLLLFFM